MYMPRWSTENTNNLTVYTTFTSFVGVKHLTSNLSNLECDGLYFSLLFCRCFSATTMRFIFCYYPILTIRTWVHGTDYSSKWFLQVCACVCVCLCVWARTPNFVRNRNLKNMAGMPYLFRSATNKIVSMKEI
jgi:hypothetical protein